MLNKTGRKPKTMKKINEYPCITNKNKITMEIEVKKMNADELNKIHQEDFDIIETELLQIEEVLKDLEKDPNTLTITQQITLLEEQLKITERLKSLVRMLFQSED